MGIAIASRLMGSWLGVTTAATTTITTTATRQARSSPPDDTTPTTDRTTSTSGNSNITPNATPMNSTNRRYRSAAYSWIRPGPPAAASQPTALGMVANATATPPANSSVVAAANGTAMRRSAGLRPGVMKRQ